MTEKTSNFIGKLRSWPAIIIIAIIIIGGSYYGYKKSNSTEEKVRYVTATVEKGDLTISVTGTGQVQAVNQVDLKSVVAGDAIDVVQVYVKNDQNVREGDLIARLDTKDAQKNIRNAQLNFDSAKKKYIQAKRDYGNEIINKLSFETQEITFKQSENSLVDAKEDLEDYYIRAPFNGIVTDLNISAGDSVSRSDILASIITSDVQAKIALNEVDVVNVKIGDKAVVTFDALPDFSLTGKISKINTIGTVSQGVVSYDAEIIFEAQNEKLKPGMNVSASIITDVKQDVLIAPSGAVKSQGGKNYVEILNDKKFPKNVSVEIGAANDEKTEVLSGINVGDQVVTQTITSSASSGVSNSQSSGGFGGGAFRALR